MHLRPRSRLLLIPLALAATACVAHADPPPWAPAHGERARHRHHYVYYPNGEMYYAPRRHLWFWLTGNGWQAGVELPMALRAYARVGGVDIELDAARPYQRHAYVRRHYGGHRVRWERREHEHGRDDHDHHGHGHRHDHGDDD